MLATNSRLRRANETASIKTVDFNIVEITRLPDLREAKQVIYGGVVGDEVIFAAGGATGTLVDAYNLITNTRRNLVDVSNFNDYSGMSGVVNGELVFNGGGMGTTKFNVNEAINPITNTKRTLVNLLGGAAERTNGGYHDNNIVVGNEIVFGPAWDNTIQVLNPMSNTIRSLPNAPEIKARYKCVTYNGEVYLIGGEDPSSGSWHRNTIIAVNPTTNTVRTLNTKLADMWSRGAVGVIGDELIIAGGWGRNSTETYRIHSLVEAVNLANDSKRVIGYLPYAVMDMFYGVVKNRLIMVCGANSTNSTMNNILVIDPHENTIKQCRQVLNMKRSAASSFGALVGDNTLVFGGGYPATATVESLWFYDSMEGYIIIPAQAALSPTLLYIKLPFRARYSGKDYAPQERILLTDCMVDNKIYLFGVPQQAEDISITLISRQ